MKRLFTIVSLLLFTIFLSTSTFAYEQENFDTSEFTTHEEITETQAMWMVPQNQFEIFYLNVDGTEVIVGPDGNMTPDPLSFQLTSGMDLTLGYTVNVEETSPDVFEISLLLDNVVQENTAFSLIKSTATVQDEIVYLNDVDDPSTVQEIISHLQANDDLSGNVTDEIIVIADLYTPDMNQLGETAIALVVKDEAYNSTMISVLINTQDVTPPTIEFTNFDSNTNVIRVPLGTSIEDIYSQYLPQDLTIIDSYDGELGSSAIVDYIGTPEGFDEITDTSIEGDYNQFIEAEDSSGNIGRLDYTIRIQDMTAPVLDGPTSIYKKDNYILSSDFFKQYFTATDNIDGDITADIDIVSNEYLGNADIPGEYEVILRVTDEDSNTSSLTLTITVSETMKSYLIVDKYEWIVPNNLVLSDSDFVQELKQIDDLPDDNFVFTSVSDTYTANADTNGSYEKVFTLASGSGSNFSRDITVSVVDPNLNIIEDDPTFLENVHQFGLGVWTFTKKTWWMFLIAGLIGYGIYKKS